MIQFNIDPEAPDDILGENPPYDDSNWREEYKAYTSNKRHLELLEN